MGVFNQAGAQCLLKMGYRDDDRAPYMSAPPDNSGLHFDIYSQAVKSINCRLEVIRKPKKRILQELENGEIDFYPEYNFTEERAQHVYYIPTGLTKKLVGISRRDFPEIEDLSQLRGYTAIVSLGSVNRYQNLEGVNVLPVPDVTLEKAVLLIQHGRADFYRVRRAQILYFLRQNPEYMDSIKIHENCCREEEITYFAFSKKSPYYQEKVNPNYNSAQSMSPTNFPTVLEPTSTAYKLQKALEEMAKNEVTQKIFEKHFAPRVNSSENSDSNTP